MNLFFARAGAVSYFIWGALHLLAAANSFKFAQGLAAGLVQGRLFQGALYVGMFAVVAIIVAWRYNWRNSRAGYWVNLLTVSAADIPFVLFIVLPGHMVGPEALVGPALWIFAVFMTTLARLTNRGS